MTTVTHGPVEAELLERIAAATAEVDYYDRAAWRAAVVEARTALLLETAGVDTLDQLPAEAARQVEWIAHTHDTGDAARMVALMRAAATAAVATAAPASVDLGPLPYPAYGYLVRRQLPGRVVLSIDVDVDQAVYPIACPRCAHRGIRSELRLDVDGTAFCAGTPAGGDGCRLVIRHVLPDPEDRR